MRIDDIDAQINRLYVRAALSGWKKKIIGEGVAYAGRGGAVPPRRGIPPGAGRLAFRRAPIDVDARTLDLVSSASGLSSDRLPVTRVTRVSFV